MYAWFHDKLHAAQDRLWTWLTPVLQPIGKAIDTWGEPRRPAAEQMLAADALLFETLALESQQPDGLLARALFRARVLAHIEFFSERAVYGGAAADSGMNLAVPVILALGAVASLSGAALVTHVDSVARRTMLRAWHACLCTRHPDVETMAELDRRATQAVLDALETWRTAQAQETSAAQAQGTAAVRARVTTGVALSGGGIRSASFALGALQELAQRRLLYGVDYLSAVSGGGYAASWLTTWAYRHRDGIRGVEDEFALGTATPAPLRWLRRYGVYLAPRFGIFAPDLWSLGGTYLRNTLPILCITVPLLAAIMAFPLETIFEAFAQQASRPPDVAAHPPMESLLEIAKRITKAVEPRPADVEACTTQVAGQLQGRLYELWRSSWRRGMTARQAAEVATSVVAAGATSMFEPRANASSSALLDPAARMNR